MGHLEYDTSVEREDTYALEHTPTWAVGLVCVVFIVASLLMQRGLQKLGVWLVKRHQIPLSEALTKVKEELMLLGFISLLLTAAQNPISRLCMPDYWADDMLPCRANSNVDLASQLSEGPSVSVPPPLPSEHSSGSTAAPHLVHARNLQMDYTTLTPAATPTMRSHAADERHSTSDAQGASLSEMSYYHFCSPGHVPVLSTESLHQLHIFIFVMAVVHVFYSCFTMLFGFTQIRSWRKWEEETRGENYNYSAEIKKSFDESTYKKGTIGRQNTFIATRTRAKTGAGIWINSFFRQFGRPVTKADYLSLRMGFITNHNASMKLNFYRYMMRSLEDDLKTVIGISGYLWMFVIFFMILNVHGWYTYFWMSFIPVMINLVIGTKLQHIITQLALETAHCHGVREAPVKPRDELFWFNKPHVLLYLIHFVLFQNAFELAFCIWLVTTFGFDSCFFDQRGFIISRVIVGILAQVLCSYSTLPLYALVSQMGSHYKKAIFNIPVSNAIQVWRSKAKETRKRRSQELTKVEHQKMFENLHFRHSSHHSSGSDSGHAADAENDGTDSSHYDHGSHHSILLGHIFHVRPESPKTSKTSNQATAPNLIVSTSTSHRHDQFAAEDEPSRSSGELDSSDSTTDGTEDENADEARMLPSDRVGISPRAGKTVHFRVPPEDSIVENDAPVVSRPQWVVPVGNPIRMSRFPSGRLKLKVKDDSLQLTVSQQLETAWPSTSAASHTSPHIRISKRRLDASASDSALRTSSSSDSSTEDVSVSLEKLSIVVDK
ncbi:hypothetical protein R1sor_015151 [Riccia sorocarpa]|uniref:MLO-like protein n=1 Tax=Riccia sorocarpa TaxID=122646 RepID=A0ABD3HEG5_9MARC